MADTRSQLAQAVAAWLRDPSTAPSEAHKAGLESAAQSISSAFGLDAQSKPVAVPGLQTIYDVFVKTQQKMGAAAPGASAAAGSSSSSSAAPAASSSSSSPADKEAAEKHKTEGNKAMSAKDFGAAIASYSKAIDLHASPVFYSNRAAAYSQVGQHDKAIEDAREAAKLDPKFGKAYSRLGHALFSSGKYEEAVEAYQQGLLVDPENKLMQSGLETAKTQASKASPSASTDEASSSPATRDGAGAGAGGFPGAGAGGMPDLSSLMNNPMMQQMAQNMMANGGLDQLMNNPMMRNMAERMGSGGGMPDMGSIQQMMQDPQMQALARQFMGGMGGGRGGGSGGAPGNMFG
ncbi:unnamed protein product [Parajaminaea phylloscopi]